MVTGTDAGTGRAARVVAGVLDPELPVLTLEELGVIRGVERTGDGTVVVTLTPTYTGCPALAVMRTDIREALARNGFARSEVRTVLSPPWTSDWITEAGRRKLTEHGIVPPGPAPRRAPGPVRVPLTDRPPVACPQCGGSRTRELSHFSSTACKSLHCCLACGEPFEQVKAH